MKENRAFFETIDDLMKLLKVLMAVVFVLYAFSGITLVKPGEVALILRFGALVGDNTASQIHHAGWLFALPYPIDEILRVPEKEILEVPVNELAALPVEGERPADTIDPLAEGYCISGDQNIFQLKASIKFQVTDPVRAIFNFRQDFATLRELLHDIVVGQITQVSAAFEIDGILTRSKEKLASQVRANSQQRLDELQSGLQILAIEFDEIVPPVYLKSDFELVNTAYIQRKNFISQANAKREEMLPKAKAAADKKINEAYAYEATLLSEAESHAGQFLEALAAYHSNPGQVKKDKLQEARNKVFANMHNLILMPKEADSQAGITLIIENARGTALPVDYQQLYGEDGH
jgi:membrane protease subunit HflK